MRLAEDSPCTFHVAIGGAGISHLSLPVFVGTQACWRKNNAYYVHSTHDPGSLALQPTTVHNTYLLSSPWLYPWVTRPSPIFLVFQSPQRIVYSRVYDKIRYNHVGRPDLTAISAGHPGRFWPGDKIYVLRRTFATSTRTISRGIPTIARDRC
jgi:hypothetical protein